MHGLGGVTLAATPGAGDSVFTHQPLCTEVALNQVLQANYRGHTCTGTAFTLRHTDTEVRDGIRLQGQLATVEAPQLTGQLATKHVRNLASQLLPFSTGRHPLHTQFVQNHTTEL